MYPEYDPNEPTLGQSFADILRGFKNPQAYQEAGKSLQNALQLTPNVTESLGRGGVAQAIGTTGDLRDLRNTVQSYLPQGVQNFSNVAEFFANPYAKALIQKAPTTEQTLETVPRVTAPYEGYKQHETLGEYIAPALGSFAMKAIKATKDLPIGMTIQDVTPPAPPEKIAEALRLPEKNAMGFYSPLDEAVMNLQNQKGTGQQYLAQLLKTGGVKEDEVITRGLKQFLTESPKVTKTEIQDFLAENPIDLRETILGAKPKINTNSPYAIPEVMKVLQNNTTPESMKISLQNDYDAYRALQQKNPELFDENAEDYFDVVFKNLVPNADQYKPAKFNTLQVGSGGENYREVQIRLPSGEDRPYVYSSNPKKMTGQVEEQLSEYGFKPEYKVVWEDGTFSGGYDKASAEAVAKTGKPSAVQGTIIKKFPNYQSAFDYAQSRPQEERLANHIRPANSQPEFVNKSHYDEPNILAHMRVNDRTIDGKKTLFIEEIQSDWHQAGRKKGYQGTADKDYTNYIKDLEKRYENEAFNIAVNEGLAEDKAKTLATKMKNKMAEDPRKLAEYFGESEKQQAMNMARVDERSLVPDAPFKKNWQELAMKRAMQMAAEGGYDRVAFTTGKQQADRYSLSKQVNSIFIKGDKENGFIVNVKEKGSDNYRRIAEDIDENKLVETVGKDIAEKYVNNGQDVFEGLDLDIGGEGMKGFYDKILPDFINKYGKKHGLKVGQTNLKKTGPAKQEQILEKAKELGYTLEQWNAMSYPERSRILVKNPIAGESVHYFDLTPQAKESFLKKGQPMFAVAPAMAITDEDSRRDVLEKLFNSKK